MRKSLILAGLGSVLFAGLPAGAQMLEMPAGKWWKRPAVVETLKLSPEQQQRLDEVFFKNRRVFIDLKADVDRRTIDLEDLLNARDVDPKKVGAASEALEQARARLGKARTMMVVEMRGILTGEQWRQIVDRRDLWRSERERDMRKRFAGSTSEGRTGRMGAAGSGRSGAVPPSEPPDEPEP
jgi:Spy/CpxP family protein refolding chaperone